MSLELEPLAYPSGDLVYFALSGRSPAIVGLDVYFPFYLSLERSGLLLYLSHRWNVRNPVVRHSLHPPFGAKILCRNGH